jgi:DNA primase
MGKISIVSAKYIIHADIKIDGMVDKPDVIGAVFGQTEGLLGSDLELRELQRSGRIGRIEVNLESKGGKSKGVITIPSSLDKAETCIVAAALEIIQRIGPCNATITVNNIEDVRISKRKYVVERAKNLLKNLMDKMMPDTQEIAEEVSSSVRVMEIGEYGRDRLPAGPAVAESDEVIVVEGRADVITLVKNGFKNVIAMNGSSVPDTIIELSRKKTLTAFVDGDRGGDLNIKELLSVADLDFVVKASDGKEVEELTKKEIHKALRSKIAAEQYRLDHNIPELDGSNGKSNNDKRQQDSQKSSKGDDRDRRRNDNRGQQRQQPASKPAQISAAEKEKFKQLSDELVGTKGACLLDSKMEILAKIPINELQSTIKDLSTDIHAVVIDESISKDLVKACERAKVRYLVGTESSVSNASTPIRILTYDDL